MIFILLLIWTFNLCFVLADDTNCRSGVFKKSKNSTQVSINITLVNNEKYLADDAQNGATCKTSCSSNEQKGDKPIDCAEVQERDESGAKSGVYTIWPRSRVTKGSIDVYCDMDDDGGAWTVIQRRGDFDSPPDYFFKDWNTYKSGFGDLKKDHWLGNDNIFVLTNQRLNILKFTLSDWEGNKTYATYDEFWIDDETRNYTSHVRGYRGTAGDSFSVTNGAPFSTKDRDNEMYPGQCVLSFKGAWWYGACRISNLNGMYLKGVHQSPEEGVEWFSFRGNSYSLKDTVIKIRPKDFKSSSEGVTPQ